MIGPALGVLTESLISAIREEHAKVVNLRSTMGGGFDRFMAYLRWSNDAVLRLSTMLYPGDLQRLVTTERYWKLQALDPSTRADTLGGFVDLEITDRERALRAAVEELESERRRWSGRSGSLVMPDTNVFVHHEMEFVDLPWAEVIGSHRGVHLIIPMLVVDELDNLKRSGKDVSRTRARTTLRLLDELVRPRQVTALHPSKAGLEEVTAELLLDDSGHIRLQRADSEIVEVALRVQRVAGRPVTVVTFDVGMKYRCEAAGLAVLRLDS